METSKSCDCVCVCGMPGVCSMSWHVESVCFISASFILLVEQIPSDGAEKVVLFQPEALMDRPVAAIWVRQCG